MFVPPEMLSDDALRGVCLEFVSREGTDYGHVDVTMEQKVEQVMAAVKRGDVLINFDDQTQSCNLVRKQDAIGYDPT